ncbi:hypothetical protein I4F81_008969 [Pyropia yezoensis]|uniref:Uncharacterized protein n=1 Tax=Pyropia yezoensis TaxID=2788 RepID=A0ACC3C9N2_PYRYE|nr:hypothetical protein I4F81_008969 [Neopyropia yezoensis]
MVPPPHPSRPLRLLCLHGYRQSASVFRARTGALRKALGRPLSSPEGCPGGGALAELIYLDAPFVVEREDTPPPPPPPPPSPLSGTGGDSLAGPTSPVAVDARSAAAASPGAAPRAQQRTWGLPNPDETAGWPAALRYLRAALVEHAPIDGLLGFSQGATVAAVLAAATAEPPPPADLPPSSQVAGSLAAPITPAAPEAAVAETAALARLRLVIVVSGFAPWRDHLAGLLSPDRPLDLPSLHIMGEADTQVPVAACRALAECFAPTQREVYVHGGGHLVPSGADARARVVSFVARFAKGEGATGRNAHL